MRNEIYILKLFKIIRYDRYDKCDVAVPFECHNCGKCCSHFTPQIPGNILPKIANLLNRPQEEIRKKHEACYLKKFTKTQADCIFLKNGKCTIYPYRPGPCRIYPLYTALGSADVDCKGYNEFNRVFNALLAIQEDAHVSSSMERHIDDDADEVCIVPDAEWPAIWEKVMEQNPSLSFQTHFKKINCRML